MYTCDMTGTVILHSDMQCIVSSCIFQCYFIESDVGDTVSSLPDADDLCVMEDTEPDVPMIDSWARGVVPMKEDKPIELGQTNGVLEEFTAGEEVEERTLTEIIGPIDKP